ncbi:MAG: DMT family transporter [Candidatus Ozemobacteraceae bacterium]
MNSHLRGVLFVLSAAVLWSFSGVGVKRLPELGPLAITGWRSLFTLPMVMGALFWVTRGIRPGITRFRMGVCHPAVWGSALSYAAMLMMFITATKWTTAANAILLQYTAPLFTAILSWPMLGERVCGREWCALSGVLLGMAFFFGEQLSADGFWGNVLAIASGIACALNTLFLRRVSISTQASPDGLLLSLPATVLGNLLIVLFCLPSMVTGVPTDAASWLLLAALGLFQLGLPYVLFNFGLRYVTAVEGILFATIEAVLNPIWTALGAGEHPSLIAMAGGCLILGSVMLYGWFRHEESHSPCLPSSGK